ncbi:MAG: LysR family transcriptional regulator [Pseudomonadales bacterium]
MRLEKVDLNLFVVFDAIYKERSVTKVANLLSLTQPAVSNALSRLRQTFDDQLFVRTPEGMAPTPVADNVISDVRKALVLLGKSVGVSARFDPSSSEKVFHLAMNDLAEALLLPALRLHLAELAPNVSVFSYYSGRQAASEELKSGALDLLIDAPIFNAREFEQMPLGELPYVVAMAKNHRLANRPLSLDHYVQAQHLHVSSRRKGRGQVDIGLHASGHKRQVLMRMQNYQVAAKVTEQTDLLWTVPEKMWALTTLAKAEVPFAVEPLCWNLFWHRSADDDPANRWMRDVIAKLFNDKLSE